MKVGIPAILSLMQEHAITGIQPDRVTAEGIIVCVGGTILRERQPIIPRPIIPLHERPAHKDTIVLDTGIVPNALEAVDTAVGFTLSAEGFAVVISPISLALPSDHYATFIPNPMLVTFGLTYIGGWECANLPFFPGIGIPLLNVSTKKDVVLYPGVELGYLSIHKNI